MNVRTIQASPLAESYLRELRARLEDLPVSERDHVIAYARAQIELDAELEMGGSDDEETLKLVLERLGSPASYAQRLRATALPEAERPQEPSEQAVIQRLAPCRTCRKEISPEAYMCPHCGVPFPARLLAPPSGYEWKSKAKLFGIPLVHVAFGRDKNGKLRVAKGIVAIGQFGIGAITIAQFGVGFLFGLGQFMIAPLAIAQFAAGLVAIGQFGIGVLYGLGQFATGLTAVGQATVTLPK